MTHSKSKNSIEFRLGTLLGGIFLLITGTGLLAWYAQGHLPKRAAPDPIAQVFEAELPATVSTVAIYPDSNGATTCDLEYQSGDLARGDVTPANAPGFIGYGRGAQAYEAYSGTVDTGKLRKAVQDCVHSAKTILHYKALSH